MAAEHVVGATAEVMVVITGVDNAATPPTVTVRLIDDNGQPITPAPGPAVPQTLVDVVGMVVAVNDVLEKIAGDNLGTTAVVRWVDPANALRWSPVQGGGSPTFLSQGWRKVGTAVIP